QHLPHDIIYVNRGWLSGTALAFAILPDPLAGRKIELHRIDSREAVERLQTAFPNLCLLLQIAQFRLSSMSGPAPSSRRMP
ncbi:hypothetical protein ACC741_38405, partial [Rhizobium johnstonii]|uniref:hypothetical protein n=1 Tax=Rhizobium johnstonii TaxID=3019933 RepID=UPI003F978E1B